MLIQDSKRLTLMLEDTENWLYEDGEDQPKQVYEEKLDALKVFIQSTFHSQQQCHTSLPRDSNTEILLWCVFSEVGSAHSGQAQGAGGQTESFWGVGEETATLHKVCESP